MNTKVRAILGFATISMLIYTAYEQNQTINTLKDTVKELKSNSGKDSLQAELFIKQTEIGRYELSLENLKEVNPKAAKQFENYLNNETE